LTLTKKFVAISIALFTLLSCTANAYALDAAAEHNTDTSAAQPIDDALPPLANTQAACVMDVSTGIVLYAKDADAQHYPASTTKLMTALLLLEYAEGNYAERVHFSNNAVFGIDRFSSHIAMDVNETLTIEECLYAILLASANEVSMAVAEHVAGSVETFAVMMTARAAELGCTGTQFTNPHGLHDSDHYTTAHDMALIMRAAAKHEIFRTIIATPSSEIPPTERQPEPRPLWNSNQLIQPGRYAYAHNIGGKTGFTNEASHTLVTLHEKDGTQLIVAVLRSEKNEIYTDTIALADYGFSRYQDIEAVSGDTYRMETDVVQISGGETTVIGSLPVAPDRSLSLRLPIAADGVEVVQIPVIDKPITAPVRAGEIVGSLQLRYAGAVVGMVNLVAAASVDALDSAALQDRQTAPVFNSTDSGMDAPATPLPNPTAIGANTGGMLPSPTVILLYIGAVVVALVTVTAALYALQRRRERTRRRSPYRRTSANLGRAYNRPQETARPHRRGWDR